ncbi:MAG: hypothetical protein AAGE52_30165 [Myxococcota bacterium]
MRVLVLLLAWGGISGLATAQESSSPDATANSADQGARVIYQEGRTAFDEGRYEHALNLFRSAYDLSPRPELLYNIGTTADRLHLNEEALEAFESYVQALPFAENREAVEVRIGILRSEIARQREMEQALQDAQGPQRRSKWWIGVLVGGLVVVGAAITAGVLLSRDDDPQYRRGDEGRLVFTLQGPQ